MAQLDTPLKEAEQTHPSDPQKTGSGASDAPGGSADTPESQNSATHGADAYPGTRLGEPQPPASHTPPAADADPGTTQSAIETGQADEKGRPESDTANTW
jgi:hypothetical protein